MSPLLAVAALALLACGSVVESQQTLGVVRVQIQFDNTADRVKSHQDVIIKYIAKDLCKMPFTNVAFVQGSLKDQSSLLNHQSVCSYDCTATKGSSVTDIIARATGKGLFSGHPVRELTDDIKDKTTPDIEVQKVLSAKALV